MTSDNGLAVTVCGSFWTAAADVSHENPAICKRTGPTTSLRASEFTEKAGGHVFAGPGLFLGGQDASHSR